MLGPHAGRALFLRALFGGSAGVALVVEVSVQLKQLAELRDAGVVTSEEFEAKKAQLLGQI